MRYIAYNIVAVCFLILAGFLAYWDRDGWGWVVFAALLCYTAPPNLHTKDRKGDKP